MNGAVAPNSGMLIEIAPEMVLTSQPKARCKGMMRQLEQRLTELPRKQAIVAYCRGPYCVLSFEAVAALRAHGFDVRRFEDGFPEWKAAGLPIEAAP